MDPSRVTVPVIGVPVDAITMPAALACVLRWIQARRGRYVCLCNAHMAVTAARDPDFTSVLAAADLVLPDGAPIAWMMRRAGHPGQQRVSGPDLMWNALEALAACGGSVYFYGGDAVSLARLELRLRADLPALRIAGSCSPPFRPLSDEEQDEAIATLNACRPDVVFISLGCPKQERWMAAHAGRIDAVLIGVGAAFDYLSGCRRRAPHWMQRSGLEWLYRLGAEPRRLWRRYLVTNTLFVVRAAGQWLQLRRTLRAAATPPPGPSPAVVDMAVAAIDAADPPIGR